MKHIISNDKIGFIKNLFLTNELRYETKKLLSQDLKLQAFVPPQITSPLVSTPQDIIFILFDMLGGYQSRDTNSLIETCQYLYKCFNLYQTRLSKLYINRVNLTRIMILGRRFTNINQLEINLRSHDIILVLKEISTWSYLTKLIVNYSRFMDNFTNITLNNIKSLTIKNADNYSHRLLFLFNNLTELNITPGYKYFNFPRILFPTLKTLSIDMMFSKKYNDIKFINFYINLITLKLKNILPLHLINLSQHFPESLEWLIFTLRSNVLVNNIEKEYMNILNLLNFKDNNKKYITIVYTKSNNTVTKPIFIINLKKYISISINNSNITHKHEFVYI